MAAFAPVPARPRAGTTLLSGARTTSLVVVGIWAATWAAETGFALWVRHAAKTPPPR